MAKEKAESKVGSIAFIIGVILAIVAGLIPAFSKSNAIITIVMLLGIIVGFMNVTAKETTPFLMAALALVIVAWAGGTVFEQIGKLALVGNYVKGILDMMITFVIPATIIVALKAIYALAADE